MELRRKLGVNWSSDTPSQAKPNVYPRERTTGTIITFQTYMSLKIGIFGKHVLIRLKEKHLSFITMTKTIINLQNLKHLISYNLKKQRKDLIVYNDYSRKK